MKKHLVSLGALLALLLASGCAAVQSPLTGAFYKDVHGPVTATGETTMATKSGSASATSVLGIFASGDASIRAAAANGGITKIHHVDYQAKSILFFWAEYITTVYGE